MDGVVCGVLGVFEERGTPCIFAHRDCFVADPLVMTGAAILLRPSGSEVRWIAGALLWRYGAGVGDLVFRMVRGYGLQCGDDTERVFREGFRR